MSKAMSVTISQKQKGLEKWERQIYSKCYFECYVKRYNWITEKYDYKQSDTRAISNGDVMSLKIPRHKNATTYNYVHMTIGCTSSVYSAATAFDRYTFTAKQYYE